MDRTNTNNTPLKRGHAECNGTHHPEFPSIIDIKKVIPKHCFQPQLSTSLYYVLKDILIVTSLYCSIVFVERLNCLPLVILWTPFYWFLQGTLFWAVFVLGHDCGHGSFSNSAFLNDVIGNFLHGFILVPYYPWKLSHKHHHKNTGNIDRDEIFYPIREKDKNRDFKQIKPLFGFGLSWFAYLFKGYLPRGSCHLNPFDPLFKENVIWCIVSIATVIIQLWLGVQYMFAYGLYSLFSHFAMPVFIFASWLVLVTFLHHTDTNVPWYGNEIWGNVKGQLSSVDRDYGWAHNLIHNIGTHQIHHLFIKIPHYHLEEATYHFRKAYPHLARISHQAILPAYFRMFHIFTAQRHIGDDVSLYVYKDMK